ncbi:hypothetical protein PR048_011724 [Dryococelus australis]|uniref:Uncharacterized protein n=1 Tax=Dryococelus australis TaxID=614101 RepID=A0ABQ9HMC3_9NEOP|nr:hypothetical protein PR048_011724 [Dryococelus australis]
MKDMCFTWRNKQVFTSPYHPYPNLVERMQRGWDSNLACLNVALSSVVQESIHQSPSVVLFGSEIPHAFLNL